jgi:flagellar basal-body rod protein FlgB
MFPDLFRTTDLLAHGLDAAQLRQDTIANNIANVDTPGFKASEVEFESYMKDALEDDGSGFQMKTTSGKHISASSGDALDVQPQVVTNDSSSMRMDGNSVDIDEQMSALAKNTIWYNTLATKLNGELGRLKTAIDGR